MADAPIDNGEKSVDRDESGRFRAGHRGGPGRPPGLRNRVTTLLEKVLAADGVAVARALIERAKAGDVAAGKVIMDRLLPIARSRPVALDLPPVAAPADVPCAVAAVLAEVARGELSPEEGAAVAGMIEAARKAFELAELEARVAAIESRLGGGAS